jgi:splicing factor 3B subunit 1
LLFALGSEFVPAREWMRICFELLDMLKAHKKSIRRAAVNTFGYIAKAIGPQDVLVTLLNNLRVQERQNRVCTTVAIAIVAETCSPFTVLPGMSLSLSLAHSHSLSFSLTLHSVIQSLDLYWF